MDKELYAEYIKRQKYRDLKFPIQDRFVKDTSKFIAAQCSRRAGKTTAVALRFLKTLEMHPGAFCPYIALTRESARNIMWPVLEEMNDKYKAGLVFTESNLTATHPNGARLQLFGADMKNFIRRLKGIKTPGAAIDEAQDFGSHLEALVDDVLTPALTDYKDSWLSITGTPGPIPMGYFYEISANKKYGFSCHYWTLFDNPYLPSARDFVGQLKAKRGWDDDHPTLQREWFNRWILDVQALLIQYQVGCGSYQALPSSKYIYILGIDIGYQDADALAIIGWNEESKTTYLIEEVIKEKQGLTELVEQIKALDIKYKFSKMMIDEGGLGKKLAEEIRRRHQIPVQPADKARKMENVAILNDHLRLGTFKAKKDSQFVKDSYQVQIDWEKSTPNRLVVKDTFHSDIIDAVLYAFKESPAFAYTPPPVSPKYGTKEWAELQEREMEEKAEEYFESLEKAEKGFGIDKFL